MTVKMSSSLPDGPSNGLPAVVTHLVHSPSDPVYAVVRLDTKRLTTELDTGEVTPTARILGIEPLLDDVDVERAHALMRSAYQARTGQAELPFDVDSDGGGE